MNKLYYPAVFQKEETGYSVWLNDVSGCISQGDTFEEAVENIKDALGLCLEAAADEHTELPEPSAPASIELEPEQIVGIIEYEIAELFVCFYVTYATVCGSGSGRSIP